MSHFNHSEIEYLDPESLKPSPHHARANWKEHVEAVRQSIQEFGFIGAVLVGEGDTIVSGVVRVEAAVSLGLDIVPCLRVTHLSEPQLRAYMLADNKLAEKAGWKPDVLAAEFTYLGSTGLDLSFTGFEISEIDTVIDLSQGSDIQSSENADDEVELPAVDDAPSVIALGDVFCLGRHRLLCGNAGDAEALDRLLDGEVAQCLLTDPPYNVKVQGHVSGLGKNQHREFAEASGEQTSDEFEQFLTETLSNGSRVCADGAIAYTFMNWRHITEIQNAGGAAFDELKNLVVWNKTNAGMGTFYRSQHELVLVWKKGTTPHRNNFGLGDKGRHRSNVWTYKGANAFGRARDEELSMHPTVKPVALLKDILFDVTKRGDIVLDIFAGSGSTLIAAERTGRTAYMCEIDPRYCEVIIRRWQKLTGRKAVRAESGIPLDDLKLPNTSSQDAEPSETDAVIENQAGAAVPTSNPPSWAVAAQKKRCLTAAPGRNLTDRFAARGSNATAC